MVECFLGYKETVFCIKLRRRIQHKKYLREIIIRFLIEGYLDFLVSSIISFELLGKIDDIFGNFSDAFSFSISCAFLFILIALPIYLISVMSRKVSLRRELNSFPGIRRV